MGYGIPNGFFGEIHGKNKNIKKNNGGGGEIRTLERLPVDGFQDRCLKPLGHPSATSRTINRASKLVKPV